ncbi:MAG: hypothetical protein QM754_09745 [Tepidisphaeraceae bacterium]
MVAHKAHGDDVLALIKTVQERVYEKHKVLLESEVKIWPI